MVDEKIIRFFKKHHVLTIATSMENVPWCANCFYVYLEEENALVFSTDPKTQHGKGFMANPVVAGSVVLETWIIGMIRGVQFRGIVSLAEGDRLARTKKIYLKKFPAAVAMETHLWTVDLTLIKMTDNRFGFGKKITWEKEAEPSANLQ